MGVPWETIIKEYRKHLKTKSFKSLTGYVRNLINFLGNNSILFQENLREEYFYGYISFWFKTLRKDIMNEVESTLEEKGEIAEGEIKTIIKNNVDLRLNDFREKKDLTSSKRALKEFIKTREGTIQNIIDKIFEKLNYSKDIQKKLKRIANLVFIKEGLAGASTGVVVAGFGSEDTFPVLKPITTYGLINKFLLYRESDTVRISHVNEMTIYPFAQREVVDTFIRGVDPKYSEFLMNNLVSIFESFSSVVSDNIKNYNDDERNQLKEILKDVSRNLMIDLKKRTDMYCWEKHTKPIIDVVGLLPKDELASMAETLVKFTAFKKKVSLESETVGGPVDVAVISKGDGFIWIKRKHYFSSDLNPHFTNKYFREV